MTVDERIRMLLAIGQLSTAGTITSIEAREWLREIGAPINNRAISPMAERLGAQFMCAHLLTPSEKADVTALLSELSNGSAERLLELHNLAWERFQALSDDRAQPCLSLTGSSSRQHAPRTRRCGRSLS